MKAYSFFAVIAAALMGFSCSNELDFNDIKGALGGTSNLSISVLTGNIESKGLVTGTYLPSGTDIGVTVLNTSGGDYDGTAYNNIKFTSSGEDASQTWSGASTVTLSATEGYCYAYYPYSPSASTITAIPVVAGETDYLYATSQSVSDKNKNATLTMQHALSAIRFALKRGTYTGTGTVSNVSVTSSALGMSGTLDATTGEVTADNLGTAVSQSASFDLGSDAENVDVVMVPSGTAGAITLSVTIDGIAYSTEVSSTTIEQGICHTYTLTVNAGSLSLSGVKVGAWGYNTAGAPTITAGGYTVMFAGSYSDISFSNSVSGSTVTIEAYAKKDYYQPNAVSISGTATLSQSVSDRLRTITLSGISSNVTVTFSGTTYNSPWVSLSDGVYYISANGGPTLIPDNSCIGVALINNAKSQRLMIEKYENANNAESTTIYTTAAQTLGSSYTYFFCWGGYGTDQSGITNYTQVGAGSTNSYGNLYLDGSGLNINPSTWTSGALSDFAGKSNSDVIKGITTNGTSSYKVAPMAYLLNAFNSSTCPTTVNQGYTDWYTPSCGQLGLIWLNKTSIDNALTAIGGTALTATGYWSSSECSSDYGWRVYLDDGYVSYGNYNKGFSYRLRLVRDL